MSRRRRPTLTLLTDNLVGSYQVQILRAIDRASASRNANLITLVGRSLQSPELGERTQTKLYDLVRPTNTDGLIIVSSCIGNYCGPDKLLEYCQQCAPIPICSIGLQLAGIPSLVVGNRSGVRALVEHLIEAHLAERIAFVAGPEASAESRERHNGYLDALAAHGIARDDRLLVRGEFSVPTGMLATRSLLRRGVEFDAIVAANDYMALAAREVLKEERVRVPEDVIIVGFDDAPFSRFALPSLTTVRQPIRRLGEAAVGTLLAAISGEQVAPLVEFEADIVLRESCGCGLSPRPRLENMPPSVCTADSHNAVDARLAQLLEEVRATVGIPADISGGWAQRLVLALRAELAGEPQRFGQAFAALLDATQANPDFADETVKVLGVLSGEIYRTHPSNSEAPIVERIWHDAQQALRNAATNSEGRTQLELHVVMDVVRTRFESIATSLSRPSLRKAVEAALPDVGIHSAFLGLSEGRPNQLRPFVVAAREGNEHISLRPLLAQRLVPDGFFPEDRHSHIVLPLSFGDAWYGLCVLAYTANERVFGMIRDQISSALKSSALRRASRDEVARREAIEQEQLRQESKIAARIQTEILPRTPKLAGLTIAAHMIPATQVGGDYYDVIPCGDGGWIGIGDVTGHGLVAGLIMLMIQGMVGALVRRNQDAQPAELLSTLNAALYENIRDRLQRNDYATLTLLRYYRDGRIRFAGAHEEIIVYRRTSGRCEILETPGVWTGVVPDITAMSVTSDAQLHDGDLVVLFTDGVVEAMNESKQLFGLERLQKMVELHGCSPVDQIEAAIVDAVQRWQSEQTDDITLLVARYKRPVVA